MRPLRIVIAAWLFIGMSVEVQARVWTDSTGRYTLDADLIALSETTVVLQRADHDLVAIPIDKLSGVDREFLKSKEAGDDARQIGEAVQTWTLRDGTKISGSLVDFASRELSIQRRRGHVYVDQRRLENLPEFYQALVPQIVAHHEQLRDSGRRALDAWLVRQRGESRTFHIEGFVLETENGDEYIVPFFLFSDEDQKVLMPGWDEWLAAQQDDDYDVLNEQAFLLKSLAAARHRDAMVQREIALVKLQLQAVQVGLTSIWEVTLYPAAGQGGPPLWVVVPGRDSRQATAVALEQNPGYIAGPVRRVSGARR